MPHCDSNDVKCRTKVGAQRDKELPQRDPNKELVSPQHHATHAAASCCWMLLLLAVAAASSCCCSRISLLQIAVVVAPSLFYCCCWLSLLLDFATAAAGFSCCWLSSTMQRRSRNGGQKLALREREPSQRYDLAHDMFLPPVRRCPAAIGRARLGC